MNLRIRTDCPSFYSDLCDVLRLFYGDVTVEDCSGREAAPGGDLFEHEWLAEDGVWVDRWRNGGHAAERRTPVCHGHPLEVKRVRKRAAKAALYDLLVGMTGVRPPWGSLTGIRPTRLLYEGLEQGLSMDEAVQRVIREFDVSPDRAQLLAEIAQM